MKLYLHIIILVLFICMPSFGQPPHIITRYNIEDGISQQTITSITKDRKGYMWFTTWNGICRFDGHSFITYRIQPGDSNDLATNRIDDIKIDSHNRLWLLDDENSLYLFPQNKISFIDSYLKLHQSKIYLPYLMGIHGYIKQTGNCLGLLPKKKR